MSHRETRIRGKLGKFAQQYARKAQKGKQPNDRHYDREVEKLAKRMNPVDLGRLLHGEDDSEE